ncbi:histidinol-phosphate transaminase [Pseudahrensia aquimaris]|uniref:Histidinol-phosphate aminotransferase n=1 Tax=Pseudahrensia aquimaris TaxID=744461 RepID=A0ABW3FAT5_9HYPH
MNTTNTLPTPVSGVMDIHAYVPGKSKAPEGVRLFKLSANETPLGPSPAAKQAFAAMAETLEDYPDGSASDLREAIARVHSLNAANIVCGSGSDELLALICQTYLGEGDEAVYSQHGFLVYRIGILAAGATPVIAPETEQTASADAMLACISDKTKVVFLANPNNPTGTYMPISEVRRLHDGLPDNVLLVLDAAYAEYVRRNDYEAGLELVSNFRNVVMTRTFSKIHGLAALRVGWMYGPDHVVDAINRVRGPFNVNAAALAAAKAAIEDREMVDKAVAHNDRWLTWTKEQLEGFGLNVTPSVGNFLLVHFPEGDPSKSAEAADTYLTERGFVLRRVVPYGFPNALRMTIGTEEANRGVVAALEKFLA